MRLLFAGFGQVGRSLARMLLERPEATFDVVGVVTSGHGVCFDPSGIDLARALAAYEKAGGLDQIQGAEANNSADTLDYDVLVEMTPLSVVGQGEPALAACRDALAHGRHVVTCNKGPIAWGWIELSSLAASNGVQLLCESTVMDGAPIFNLRRHCLPGLQIVSVEGILNSTTNVALEGLEQGLSLDDALGRARDLGIAEADLSHDVDGWDAAVKLAVLSNILLEHPLTPEQVGRHSLRDIDTDWVRGARQNGSPVKMVCRAEITDGAVRASVCAQEVAPGDAMAGVSGSSSLLRLRTELPGALTIVEEDPSVETTAYGVLVDLLSIASRHAG